MREKEREEFMQFGSKKEIFKTCGRYIFKPEFFELYNRMKPAYLNREFDDRPIISEMINNDTIMGIFIDGRYFDTGNPVGYNVTKQFFEK